MDSCLFSESIIRELRNLRMHYIVPLRRNSTPIPLNIKFDSAFMYNGRPIKAAKKTSRIGYIYTFRIPIMREEEESSILRYGSDTIGNI